MNLRDIGFYTLCDKRAKNASQKSPLWRCELILTDRCNFRCPYCRGLSNICQGNIPYEQAERIIHLWASQGLKNIRFSGGEPTLYENLIKLVKLSRKLGIKRIAISTNGSADISFYRRLIGYGVNDFSISLDACCSTYGDKMAGIDGAWNKVIDNIKVISDLSYTTVGIVVTDDNYQELPGIINLAHELRVDDIRIISSAQSNKLLEIAKDIPQHIIDIYPILRYRVNNIIQGRNVRGLRPAGICVQIPGDNHQCPLVLDDMAIANDYHFPCIIYLREKGDPIGKVSSLMRHERYYWFKHHDSFKDPICLNNCIDVCIDYNNKYRELHFA